MMTFVKKIWQGSAVEPPAKAVEVAKFLSERSGLKIKPPTYFSNLKKLNQMAKNEPFLVGFKSSSEIVISGFQAGPPKGNHKIKKCQAIVTLYNDKDIIDQVIKHLLSQGIAVHIVDNWSSDGSFELVRSLASNNQHLSFERYPKIKPKYYQWGDLLKRVEEIAKEGSFEWYIHYDADELRISPWPEVSLVEAVSFVDSLGYNALDFTILDFRPIKDGFDGSQKIESFIEYFEFGRRPGHFQQIKAWKNTGQEVDISSTGGHEAVFAGRKIYPLKFITKHYPLRSNAQARRKIFEERLPRISPQEKKKGWHIQYNKFSQKDDFIWPKTKLIKFDNHARQKYLIEMLTGVGIERE